MLVMVLCSITTTTTAKNPVAERMEAFIHSLYAVANF